VSVSALSRLAVVLPERHPVHVPVPPHIGDEPSVIDAVGEHTALTYHTRTGGPLSATYVYCFAGFAASEQLDMAAAETHFREALRLATTAGGRHSFPARLAAVLLGDLLYERGEIAEDERMLDVSQELGTENGTVDFMIARYTTSARIKALHGDLAAAAQYLDDGAQVAEILSRRLICVSIFRPCSTSALDRERNWLRENMFGRRMRGWPPRSPHTAAWRGRAWRNPKQAKISGRYLALQTDSWRRNTA
jgi:MalT-like TPR region